ncbi:MAG: alanine--tRNA ligase-related protein [bacterium]|nr:alanine--tRNA ligase-related protein [bacterium]
MPMNSKEIRKKFLKYFEEHGHKIVESSSLLPDDPSVLLTTAGMQQFKPYFVGKANPIEDFGSLNVASVQKCFRTSDIDEVGDETHLTFFEMLGNFSFGGYFKKEAILYAHEFITKVCGLQIDYVSVFEGDEHVPEDLESGKIWRSIDEKVNIKKCGRADNFWGPTGSEGPCGPTTEIYVKNASGNSIEIWNLVFNEYYQNSDKSLRKLETPGVDTGMGLERLAMVCQNKKNIFETDLFEPFINLFVENAKEINLNKNFNIEKNLTDTVKRMLVDHARGIIFLISDGILPSNKDAGYIIRRLIRRYVSRMYQVGSLFGESLLPMVEFYKNFYSDIDYVKIDSIFSDESSKFLKTLTVGLHELHKLDAIDAVIAFNLYQSYGLPYEVIKDFGGNKTSKLNREEFEEEFKKHQEKSRAGLEKKFGGHGLILDTGELKAGSEEELKKVTRLHTATHLMQQALRNVLGSEVNQAGSDITAERTRFDFTFSRKLTPEEIQKVEDEVNSIIEKDLPMQKTVLPKAEAEKTGALYFSKNKYPDIVNVYFAGKTIKDAYSKEFCGGPHVNNTGEIGKFKIIKEEAVSAGTRRIRATVSF